MAVRSQPSSAREAPERDEEPLGLRGLLAYLAGEARNLMLQPVERLAEAARDESDRVARASRAEASRLAAAARRWAVLAGACFVAAILLVIGLSGALGELFGRPWAGQLAAGGFVLLSALAWVLISRWRSSRKAEAAARGEGAATRGGADEGDDNLSLASLLLVGAAGWLAGHYLSGRKKDDRD